MNVYTQGARFKLRRQVEHDYGRVYPAGALVLQNGDLPFRGRLAVTLTDLRLMHDQAHLYVPLRDLVYVGPPYDFQPGDEFLFLGYPQRRRILDRIIADATGSRYLKDTQGGYLSIGVAFPVRPRYPLDQPDPLPPPPRARQYVTDVASQCSVRNRYDDDLGCYEDPVFYECLSNDPDKVVMLPSGYCINRSTADSLPQARDPLTRAPLDAEWRETWGIGRAGYLLSRPH
jgi:hypothetical protein